MAQTNNGDQALEHNIESPKDIIAGQASGKMVKHDEGYQPWENYDMDESIVNNPLYGQNGQGGVNKQSLLGPYFFVRYSWWTQTKKKLAVQVKSSCI